MSERTVVEDGTDEAGGGSGRTERESMYPFDTERWVGIAGAALVLIAVGVLTTQPGPILVGAVGVGYGLYTRFGEAPEATLEVARTVSDETPEPGDEVRVTVRVTHVGDTRIADLRLIDGVPPGLEVIEGPARFATALEPGGSATFSYAVRASRGEHTWGTMRAITRNPAGSRERETRLDHGTRIVCTPELTAGSDLPLRGLTTQYHGRVSTNVGGSGVEFFATREYRRGDPLKRIDWNRRARTGELATLELREERAATVVLLIDAREEAYVASEPTAETAVEASIEAAGQAFGALLDAGDRVGVATLGAPDCWLPPGTGTSHAVRGRNVLATDPALAPTPGEEVFHPSLWFRRFRRRLPTDAQVLFFSPLVDRYPATVAKRIDAYGHLVTVLSPNVTTRGTLGGRLVAHERRERVRGLRGAGIRTIEWGDRSFPVAVAGATRRWSR
ncbi:DUF58 domain-containing protein [Halorubrum vacuolatum]|uniref:Conserved repeat domain-containing protein n=1 Tax=Halorubrum vacuolatum TaxID=63740 RepID=A0A238W352_HALVU|nr:DUF58 domain-containing protein [Halorubrum vacuolatum]SNR40129.1 conserved repeat domain-containing protein [Halorubrum vacuolatum]